MDKRTVIVAALCGIVATSACGSSRPQPEPTPDPPDESSEPAPQLAELREVWEGRFATSLVCSNCHSNSADADAMRDSRGDSIAPYDLWQSTMMANSARDPLWRAVVSAEVAAIPSRKADIEATCMTCHAPMASKEALLEGESLPALSLLYEDTPRSQIALDGVSCATCHQIQPDGLGEAGSFSGNFGIGDDRLIYGPHSDPFAMPMMRFSEFEPTRGDHIGASAMCASCHTLTTRAILPSGQETEFQLLEQSPYLEWRNSAYTTESSAPGPRAADCQTCHVPTTDRSGQSISTAIARNPGGFDFPPIGDRDPYGRHVFVGGNTLVPQILRDNAADLRPHASAAAFDATIAAAREQLQERTARVEIERAGVSGSTLAVDVRIRVLTGHKFPSAHPSRRAWLHVVVRDATDQVVFESGAYNENGVLVDGAGAALASELVGGGFQPHRDRVTSATQTAVFESVMADSAGNVTYRLVQGARYIKDNRLLPSGWSETSAGDVAAVGVDGDADFLGGGDVIHYEVAVGDAGGPLTVEVELLYQTLGARYASELFAFDTAEVAAFRDYYAAATNKLERVASASVTVP